MSNFMITTRRQSTYHDDYVYAITFDPETETFGATEIDGTSGCYSPTLRPPTATDPIIDQAKALMVELLIEDKIKTMSENPYAPVKGKEAKSLTTKGKNVGIVGKVMWIGLDKYSRDGSYRVGLKVDGETKLRYLPIDRVSAVEPVVIDPEAIRSWALDEVDCMARIDNWYDTLRNLNLIHRI